MKKHEPLVNELAPCSAAIAAGAEIVVARPMSATRAQAQRKLDFRRIVVPI
jgi:hypothetical protein